MLQLNPAKCMHAMYRVKLLICIGGLVRDIQFCPCVRQHATAACCRTVLSSTRNWIKNDITRDSVLIFNGPVDGILR